MQDLRYSPYFKSIFSILDASLLCWFIFGLSRNGTFTETNVITAALLLFLWFLLSSRTRIYHVSRTLTYTGYIERLIIHLLFFVFGTVLISKITRPQQLVLASPTFLFYFSAIIFVVKSLIFIALKWARLRGYNYRNVMFLSDSGASQVLKDILSKRKDYGYRLYTYSGQWNVPELKAFWTANAIHTLYIPLENGQQANFINELIAAAETCKVRISVVPDILHDQFADYQLSYAQSQPILEKSKLPLEFAGNFILKRTFDILFSAIFLVFVATWLFPIIALLIKLDNRGSVLFKQKRQGFDNQPFTCLKFRTMIQNDDAATRTTQRNDHRITRIGRFLRQTSLDETPQFINVLKGDMSVVGPRPHMVCVDDHYKTFIHRYTIRSRVRPGITGLAQINGLRGENGDMNIQMQKRILADAFYIKNWNLSLDLIIIFKTAILLLKGDKKAF